MTVNTPPKNIEGWVRYLSGLEVTGQEMSQEDFNSRCLMDIRSLLIRQYQSLEHQEGMAVAREKVDHQMAQMVGIAPMTGEERVEAIDNWNTARQSIRGADPVPVVDLSSLPPKRDALDS